MSKVRKKVALVLGMHRSGTSLVSAILERLGIEFGDDLLGAMDGVNEKGFWESRRLVEAHEALLKGFDRQWYDFSPLPIGWLESEGALHFKRTMKEWIQEEFVDAESFGLKDPRMCLFLPLWKEIFHELGIDMHCVVVLRNPLEIAHSLMKRDNIPPLYSLVLTRHYLSSIWDSLDEAQISTITYADVLQDWQVCFGRIADIFQLVFDTSVLGADAGGVLDANLRHNVLDEKIYKDLISIMEYGQLRNKIDLNVGQLSDGTINYLSDVRAVWQGWHTEILRLQEKLEVSGKEHAHAQEVVAERDTQLSELTEQLAALGAEHEHAQAVVSERDAQLSELTEQLASLGAEHEHAQAVVSERDAQLSELTAQLAALGAEHEHAQAVVSERDAQLANIYSYMNKSLLGKWLIRRMVKNETRN